MEIEAQIRIDEKKSKNSPKNSLHENGRKKLRKKAKNFQGEMNFSSKTKITNTSPRPLQFALTHETKTRNEWENGIPASRRKGEGEWQTLRRHCYQLCHIFRDQCRVKSGKMAQKFFSIFSFLEFLVHSFNYWCME